ncbi:MAG: EamA family transporter [Burkholderiales bacterium]|nr:EamA family transporter [Burkholderiales bacterium]
MRTLAWLVLGATLVLWSGNWIVARAVRDEIAPGFATARRGPAPSVLAPPAPFRARRLIARLRHLAAAEWRPLLALGFFGGGLHLALQWLGLHYTTATSATLYLSTAPATSSCSLRARCSASLIGALQWTGVAVSFSRRGPHRHAGGTRTLLVQHRRCARARVDGDVGRLHRAIAPAARRSRHAGISRAPLPDGAWVDSAVGRVGSVGGREGRARVGRRRCRVLFGHRLSFRSPAPAGSHVVTQARRRAVPARRRHPFIARHRRRASAAVLLGETPRWFHFAGIALILAGVALSTPIQRRIGRQ